MQYQEPPPIFGSLIFYQVVNCNDKQLHWIVQQLVAILKGQKIINSHNNETIQKILHIAVSNAMYTWNDFNPKKNIAIQLFVGEHRWGLDILNRTPQNEEAKILNEDKSLEEGMRFLDEWMDEVYSFLNHFHHFMMIKSR
jgi:hypothetical protein